MMDPFAMPLPLLKVYRASYAVGARDSMGACLGSPARQRRPAPTSPKRPGGFALQAPAFWALTGGTPATLRFWRRVLGGPRGCFLKCGTGKLCLPLKRQGGYRGWSDIDKRHKKGYDKEKIVIQ